MNKEEFEFWQRAYLAVLGAVLTIPSNYDVRVADHVAVLADDAVRKYRKAKATVVQTTYATRD